MKELFNAVLAMDEKTAMKITDSLIADGKNPMEVLDAYRDALAEVGRRFEAGEFFLPELIMSGEMLKEASEKIKPLLKGEVAVDEKRGKVIIATVEGDIHDIGKDIVTLMLDINGYDVLDLGVNVPAQKVVDAAKDFLPQVIGLSGFLTLAYDPMKATIAAVKEENMGNVKFMIGGGQMGDEIREYVGADVYGKDAIEAVRLCEQWI